MHGGQSWWRVASCWPTTMRTPRPSMSSYSEECACPVSTDNAKHTTHYLLAIRHVHARDMLLLYMCSYFVSRNWFSKCYMSATPFAWMVFHQFSKLIAIRTIVFTFIENASAINIVLLYFNPHECNTNIFRHVICLISVLSAVSPAVIAIRTSQGCACAFVRFDCIALHHENGPLFLGRTPHTHSHKHNEQTKYSLHLIYLLFFNMYRYSVISEIVVIN